MSWALTSQQGLCLRTCSSLLLERSSWSSCLEGTAGQPANRGTAAVYRGHTSALLWLISLTKSRSLVYTFNPHSKVYLFSLELQFALCSTLQLQAAQGEWLYHTCPVHPLRLMCFLWLFETREPKWGMLNESRLKIRVPHTHSCHLPKSSVAPQMPQLTFYSIFLCREVLLRWRLTKRKFTRGKVSTNITFRLC